jgi:hypothetical protein
VGTVAGGAGGLGRASGGAGGNSEGSAEMRLGLTGGGLAVGVVDGGTLRAEEGLAESEGGDGVRRGGTLRAGTGLAGTGVARRVRSVWISWRVVTWLSVRGARGELA